jgi:hypothetical protein
MRSPEPLRAARTESLFRDVNERIAEAAKGLHTSYAEFVCECADPTCDERFSAQLEEYETVRADGRRFLIVPGHEEPSIERVVDVEGEHRVVQKDEDDRVEREVLELDPRTDGAGPYEMK